MTAPFLIRPSADDAVWIRGMDWIKPAHSRSKIDKAARLMLQPEPDLFNDPGGWTQWLDARTIVDNWRSSHNYPLNTFKVTLRQKAFSVDDGALVAQRIKRMSSIEAKLRRFKTMQMCQMQDLGGCRAIVGSISLVNKLRRRYEKSDLKHELDDVDDYIIKPKASGYRGAHLIYRYFSDKPQPAIYNGLFIEMQLRTRRQHAWATAVETVGTFLRQSLKASQGEDRWLRFFSLMGSVIARGEGGALVPNTPTTKTALISELREAASRLNVVDTLKTYSQVINIALEGELKGQRYFLLKLVPSEQQIIVTGYSRKQLQQATKKYSETEVEIAGKPGAEAVLVSVDSMALLKRAYPNYFLDTDVFLAEVQAALKK
jgi:adenylate cyclase class IV